MRPSPAVIPQVRFQALCQTIAVRQVVGMVTVLGTLAWMRPATVAAQAIGTMQVEARVTDAEAEWSSLQAVQQIAADPATAAVGPARPSRIDLPLSQVLWNSAGPTDVDNRRPAFIAVQYLRN